MMFDGEHITTRALDPPASPIHIVVVDLCATKDTTAILTGLKSAYPVARTDADMGIQKLLGVINQEILKQAVEALQNGDAQKVSFRQRAFVGQ